MNFEFALNTYVRNTSTGKIGKVTDKVFCNEFCYAVEYKDGKLKLEAQRDLEVYTPRPSLPV